MEIFNGKQHYVSKIFVLKILVVVGLVKCEKVGHGILTGYTFEKRESPAKSGMTDLINNNQFFI